MELLILSTYYNNCQVLSKVLTIGQHSSPARSPIQDWKKFYMRISRSNRICFFPFLVSHISLDHVRIRGPIESYCSWILHRNPLLFLSSTEKGSFKISRAISLFIFNSYSCGLAQIKLLMYIKKIPKSKERLTSHQQNFYFKDWKAYFCKSVPWQHDCTVGS